MQVFDLAIAYKWIFDKELVDNIENVFHSYNLTTFVIHKGIIHSTADKVQNGEIYFRFFLDRAADEDEEFEPLAETIISSGTKIINHHHLIDEAIDKAEILPKLLKAGIPVPPTFILSPYEDNPSSENFNFYIAELGAPFIIKPAYYSGGGEGANPNGYTIEDINNLRKELYDDRYLLQKKIYSKYIEGFKAWFRAFFLFDEVVVVQWDDDTRLYDNIAFRKLPGIDYDRIISITSDIAEICRLNYFSTEITVDENGNYWTIDFVNDPCDFRRQSVHRDGVPDFVVDKFIEKLVEFVKS